MTVSDVEYTARILSCMSNSIVEFEDGSFGKDIEWFNLEDLLRTMRNRHQGADKPRLRTLLSSLLTKGFIEIREGKKQSKPQSKGEYALTKEGKMWLVKYREIMYPISGVKKEND